MKHFQNALNTINNHPDHIFGGLSNNQANDINKTICRLNNMTLQQTYGTYVRDYQNIETANRKLADYIQRWIETI